MNETNPMMKVADIHALSEIAKGIGALTVVDNTFLTPYFQKPLQLGADIVTHSSTKYLGGHNDTISGIVVVKDDEEIAEKIHIHIKSAAYLAKRIKDALCDHSRAADLSH